VAHGPIHILTGAGGGFMHPSPPPPVRKAYYGSVVGSTFCFSLLEVDGRRVDFRQVDEQGNTVDSFTLTK
jgi:hypothetical protein